MPSHTDVNERYCRCEDSQDALGNAVIGNNLKLCVIAEGAENWMQVEFLRKRHREDAQGYLFGRPVPADAFAKLLAAGSRLMAA